MSQWPVPEPSTPDVDEYWLAGAVALSRNCPPTAAAYAVGALLVLDGQVLASGYSRQRDPVEHAEEVALAAVARDDPRLRAATLYSSVEPCSERRSRPMTCTQLIIAAGLPRVVFALREPPVLADCRGAELLVAAGVEVVEYPGLADEVRRVNRAVLGGCV